MVRRVIQTFTDSGLEIGICGQAPSDHPEEYPEFLVNCGITSISVTPDTAVAVRLAIQEAERKQHLVADTIKVEMSE
jgi:pyruvate,water dikinase